VTAWPFFDANAVYGISATSASDTQAPSWSSHIARGYRTGVQASPGMAAMAAMAARMLAFTGTVTENRAPARRIAPVTAALQNAESSRTTIIPVHPHSTAVAMARVARLAAPRAEAALPPRSLVPAITGAAIGVLTTAASVFSPRTSSDLPWIEA
jgi:hypothetical protein